MPSAFGAQISSVVLGVLFIVSGSLKTVKLNASLYREMLKAFKNLTDVSPLQYLGLAFSPTTYMQILGVTEIILGTALVCGTFRSQKLACVGLMGMMLLTSYSQLVLHDFSSIVVPIGYFLLLGWLYASLECSRLLTKSRTL